jgi:signal transduction histidine kinase/DNA-binding response OmpR family regulator
VRDGDPLKKDLLEVVNAATRAAALTRQLLAFSRKQILQPVALDLNQIAEGVEKMLQRILGEDIKLVQTLAPDLGLTLADPGQLEQVLMNLVVNARDAMPEGGKLIIETSNVEIDEEYAARHMAVTPGSYVQLAVSDTGCGMDEQTRARIFEPFFTTKEQGKGTGLGLSTVYGIVKQSGGSIWVDSEPGQGTTFKICLPRELCATTVTLIKNSTIPRLFTGTETILLVEDEEALREIAQRSLEAAGYRVLTASDGHEALLVSADHAGDIQLLLTDVVMPRMSGRVLAQEVAKTRPTVKVVYMSGYTDDAILRHGVLEAGIHFLAKPFTSAGLTRKVREVLDDGAVCVAGGREPAAKDDESPMIDCGGREEGAQAKRPPQRESKGKIRVTSRTDGRNVKINISDTDAGIPEAIRGRVFEPFFTTKAVGRGVGQSLAIARGIVEEQHGGRLTFESTVGVGTTFTLELPREPLEGPGAPSLLPGQATQRAEKRRPRILVIDDEPPLGVAMGRVLRREFEVVLATGGAQALDLVASDQSFDVLLCDLQMPEMSGMDFHDHLLARWPQLASRIVFMSGGASTPRAQDFLQRTNRPWLAKPMEPAELISTVRSILTDKRSP